MHFDQFVSYARGRVQITDDELEPARSRVRPGFAPKGGFLVRAGDPLRGSSFILRGLVRQVFTSADGRERVNSFGAENSLMCPWGAALRGEASDLSIQALEPTWYLAFPIGLIEQLVREHPGWRDLTARLTEEKFLAAEHRSRTLLLADATERYQAFLDESPVADRVPLAQVAAYIGVTPEALSRIRRRLLVGA